MTANNEIVLTGIFAQLYTRLVLAAILRTPVYYSDLVPVVFGLHLSNISTAQYDALWDMLVKTMRVDIANGRIPVAAMYVSKATDSKTPGKRFFREYRKLTGIDLQESEWSTLVSNLYAQYTPDLRG